MVALRFWLLAWGPPRGGLPAPVVLRGFLVLLFPVPLSVLAFPA